jgi:F420-dependent oxidoreductase-like protein
MRICLHVVRFDWPDAPRSIPSTLTELAVVAEEGGLAALSVMDHWFAFDQMQSVDDPVLESYATLAFLAAHTRRLQLRTLVTGVTYRHPGVLAKTVTTLDVLSGGRAQLGLGAAWYEREHRGLGVPYPPVSERFERLEETIQICLQMWSDDDGPYAGEHYRLAETICEPKPIDARPALVIGGNGEQKTLRLVARYADACNLMLMAPEDAAPKLEALRRHCDDVGRDYDAISKGVLVLTDPLIDLASFFDACDRYASMGVDELVLMASDVDVVTYVARIANEVVPHVATGTA